MTWTKWDGKRDFFLALGDHLYGNGGQAPRVRRLSRRVLARVRGEE